MFVPAHQAGSVRVAIKDALSTDGVKTVLNSAIVQMALSVITLLADASALWDLTVCVATEIVQRDSSELIVLRDASAKTLEIVTRLPGVALAHLDGLVLRANSSVLPELMAWVVNLLALA